MSIIFPEVQGRHPTDCNLLYYYYFKKKLLVGMLRMLHAFLHSANANHEPSGGGTTSLSRGERGIAGGHVLQQVTTIIIILYEDPSS